MKNQFLLIFSIVFVVVGMISCSGNTNVQRDEANIRKAYKSLEQKDFATFTSLCTEDFTELALGPQPTKGIKAAIELYKPFMDAFPDIKFDIQSIVPDGKGRYFLEIHMTGKNTGPFMMLPPTGNSIDIHDVDIVELNKDGICMSHWSANPDGALDQIGYGSINNPSTGLVLAAYDAFGKGDIPAMLTLCSDDIVFEIHDRTFDTKSRMFTGKEEVAKFFAELNSKITYSKFLPVRFLADGNDVAVSVDVEFTQKSNNTKYKNNYAHRFQTKDGKIIYFKGMDGMVDVLGK